MEFIIDIDIHAFLFLNGLHAPWLDKIMYWITNKYVWFPFYLLLIILISWKLGWKGTSGIILMIVAIGLADIVTSGIMKPFFERLRPCHNPDIANLVHMVTHCGGKFGFASGHAANSFALAASLFLIYRKQLKYIAWIFLWAFIVSYSRIYVGVHYPLDIIAGSIVGIFFGYMVNIIYNILPNNLKPGTV